MNEEINLGKLQFYWRMKEEFEIKPNVVPDFVDFSFSFDPVNQLIIQKKNDSTLEYLDVIYKENFNVGYLQEGHALATLYGDDFLNFLLKGVKKYNSKTKNITEIGAGGCYILKQLKEKNFEVQAIDPSPISVESGKKLDIEVIREFYPCDNYKVASDLIFHYDVLEHVEDPVAFLNHNNDNLNDNGIVVLAVPNCTDYIKYGDISMILHEHINYFDEESLRNTVNSSNLDLLEIKKSDYGKVLYCVAKKSKSIKKVSEPKSWVKFKKFKKSVEKLKNNILSSIKDESSLGKKIGFYIPLRALPYLSLIDEREQLSIRFFDDNKALKNKLFDGFDIPIEDMEDLILYPVDTLYIFSEAFGDLIKEKVHKVDSTINILTLSDLFK